MNLLMPWAELLNEDMELEAVKVVEQTEDEAGDEPAEEPQCFNIKEMALNILWHSLRT